MKISVWTIGKTQEKYLEEGIRIFVKRLDNYTRLEWLDFKDVKSFSSPEDCKKKESELVISKLKSEDFFIILDENGKQFSSTSFADYLQQCFNKSMKHIVFFIGGAYGIHESLKERANFQLSLSKMTFSHQMVRLFFAEQLYRAFTILQNEKYHNP